MVLGCAEYASSHAHGGRPVLTAHVGLKLMHVDRNDVVQGLNMYSGAWQARPFRQGPALHHFVEPVKRPSVFQAPEIISLLSATSQPSIGPRVGVGAPDLMHPLWDCSMTHLLFAVSGCQRAGRARTSMYLQ